MQPGAGPADLAADQRQRDQAARVVGAVGMLGDAHAPEDDRALSAREGARDLAEHVRLDPADRRHLFRRERPHAFGELVEVLGVGLDVLSVVELLFDDDVQHRVEHRNVGAVLELHHLPRVALHPVAARIHEDQLGAALGRLLEEGRRDRMVLGRIGADHDDDVRVLALVKRRGDCSRADALQQRCDRRRVAKPRAMVDVVGSEAGSHQLLEQIGLFVRALRGAETGERLRAITVADLHQPRGCAIERLLPRRRAEMRPRIGRIDQIVGRFPDAVLADHRLGQALWIADVVESEAALHAEAVLVGRAVAPGDRDQLVVLDLIGELAADAAIRTDAVHLAVGELGADVLLVDERRRHQRPGRAGLHAFAAGDAGRCAHWIVEVENDLLAVAAAGHADDVIDLDLAAGADAEIALNAGVEVDRHRRMAAVRLRHFDGRALGEAAGLDVLALGDLPKLGIRIVRDLERRLIGDEQFGDHAARGLGAVGLRLHHHARRRGADAARGQHALALDLHHADAAVAVRPVAGLGQVAEVRQLDVVAAPGGEDRLTRKDVDLPAVHDEGVGLLRCLGHRAVLIITNAPAASSVHRENTSTRTTADWARPDRARRSRRRASGPTVPSAAPDPRDRFPSA